ncbi:MAG: ATP-binding protein [Bacteroidota bacterium]|nr:ATP-binding protein [Bacteroidota bacterium]
MNMSLDLETNNFENEVSFPSVFSNISYSEKIIHELEKKISISEEKYGNILLSLSEAINNAIVHGNKFNPEKNVKVLYKYSNRLLLIEVKDQGEGFDPNQIANPTSAENIENLYGRGVYIIISLSDKVEFEYDKGQLVRIMFNI